jgi:hypothetical protein
MLRDAVGAGGESAALAVMRILIAAIAIGSLASICLAEVAMGPTLAPSQTLHGRFVQVRHLKGFASTLKSGGTFVLAPGRGLIWRVEVPIQATTVITPTEIRQIINGSEVQRIDTAKNPFIAHFYDMLNGALMGDWAAMSHDFAITITGNRGAWRTVLAPLRPNDPIAGMLQSIVVTGGRMVNGVEIKRTNGDFETMGFLNQTVSSVALSGHDARLLDNQDIKPVN